MKKIFYKLFVGIGVVLMLFYYTITAAGKDACLHLAAEWRETKEIMDKLLEVEGAL